MVFQVLINPVYENNELNFCIKKTDMKSLLIGNRLPKRNYYEKLLQMIPELQNSKPGSWKSKEFPTLSSIITTDKEKLP